MLYYKLTWHADGEKGILSTKLERRRWKQHSSTTIEAIKQWQFDELILIWFEYDNIMKSTIIFIFDKSNNLLTLAQKTPRSFAGII